MTRPFLTRFSLFLPVSLAALAGLLILWPARRVDAENFVFYLPNQRRLIPIRDFGETPYLPVVPVLQLVGPLNMELAKNKSLQVWVGTTRLRLRLNETKVKIGRETITLPFPIMRENGEWLAPIEFISAVLPEISSQPVVYRPGALRAYLDGVTPITFTVQLQNQSNGARLAVNFSGKVSIEARSANGRWVVLLGGAPVEPLEKEYFFQSPYLRELQFDDQDGRPKLILTPAAAGMNFTPRLTAQGSVFEAEVVSPASAPRAIAAKKPAPAVMPRAPSSSTESATPALPVIALDAGHGGADTGARSQDGILEKNIDAQAVGWVNSALSATHQYRTVLTRPGDSDPTFGQRALTSNTAQPLAFLTFHAGDMGDRSPVIMVYSYQPSSPLPPEDRAAPAALFVPWELAQNMEQARSQALARDLQQQLSKLPGVAAVQYLQLPVRQLRSIAAPAAAVELGTLSPQAPAGVLAQPAFLRAVAASVVAAIEQFAGNKPKP